MHKMMTALKVITTIALVGTIVWFVFEPGFEPAITAIVLLAAIVKIFWKDVNRDVIHSSVSPDFLALDASLHPEGERKHWFRHYDNTFTVGELLYIASMLIGRASTSGYGSEWVFRDAASGHELGGLASSAMGQNGAKSDTRAIAAVGIRPNMTLQIVQPGEPFRPSETGGVTAIQEAAPNVRDMSPAMAAQTGEGEAYAAYPGGSFLGSDFSGMDLTAFVSKKADYRGANFEGTNLEGAHFKGSNFENANFKGANLSKVNFKGANLKGAILDDADLSGAQLIKTNLSGASIKNTILAGANTKKAIMPGSAPLIRSGSPPGVTQHEIEEGQRGDR